MLTIFVDSSKAQALLTGALTNIATNLDTNKILDKAGAALLNRIRTRYLSEVDPDNVPWLPSAAGQKRRSNGGTGTLFDSGDLFNSIQLHKDGDLDRSISTDIWYAPFHQYGEGDQVMRRFLGFNEDDQNLFTRIVENEVNSLVKKELANIGGE